MEHPTLLRVPGEDPEEISRKWREEGWTVFLLPQCVVDQTSFFRAVKTVLPLDPPLVGDDNWDALSDSLWSGLHNIDAKRIVIIWPQADLDASRELQTAAEVLDEVALSLGDEEATNGSPKEVCIVMA